MESGTRLYSLDYLRGLAALGIMIYHYLSWELGTFSADTIIGRIGIYGVSIFYILSGLTLYYVYFNKMSPNANDLQKFYLKRIVRIFPLLWLVIILSSILNKEMPDFLILFLNITGLFGIFKWDAYIGTGVWSIGNELVFYLFFPVFIYFSKKLKFAFLLLSVILFCIYLFFAYFQLTNSRTLIEQWSFYINPLNQVFLFLCGFLMGMFATKYSLTSKVNIILLASAILLFAFYPVSGNMVNLVIGHNRILFTVLCLCICLSFYKSTIKLPYILDKYLTILGEASYSVYLLHPIVWFSAAFIFKIVDLYIFQVPFVLRFLSSVGVTLFVSYWVYLKYEKYFMEKGRVFAKKLDTPEKELLKNKLNG